MPNGTYGGVRGEETKVGQKTFVSRPTRLLTGCVHAFYSPAGSVYLSSTSLCTHTTTVYTTLYSSGSRPSVSCGEFGGGRANIKAHSVRRPCLIPLMATILRCRKKTGAADPQARLRQGKATPQV